MFVRNCWYCAGWDHQLSQGRDSILSRRIANEALILYRKPDGNVVAMEDRCCHRQAPLHLGRKEGDAVRCMYHGMKFGPDGKCIEIPGQEKIPPQACVRTFPVVEKDNWIWVWMGEPAKADPGLICFAVGPGDKNWNIRTSQMRVHANHRLEIANLTDLSHLTWIHRKTLGGNAAWVDARIKRTPLARGVNSEFWMYSSPAPAFALHLFPAGMLFDIHMDVDVTLPCNFILHFQVWTAGTAMEGPSNGQLMLDTYSSQAVTAVDEDTVDYYYSWGASVATDSPGMSDMLRESVDAAFLEDKAMLEAHYRNLKERPAGSRISIVHDAGPAMMLRILDKFLAEEASGATGAHAPARLSAARV